MILLTYKVQKGERRQGITGISVAGIISSIEGLRIWVKRLESSDSVICKLLAPLNEVAYAQYSIPDISHVQAILLMYEVQVAQKRCHRKRKACRQFLTNSGVDLLHRMSI